MNVVEQAFALLDSETYEQALTLIDERFEMLTTPEVASEPGLYQGPEGVRRWWTSFLEAMDYVKLVAQRFHDVGDDRAIVEYEIRTRGKRSGIETKQAFVALATVAGDKLVRLEFFTTFERARAAARPRPR